MIQLMTCTWQPAADNPTASLDEPEFTISNDESDFEPLGTEEGKQY